MVKFIETELPGVFIVEPDVFEDDRGFFLETYRNDKYGAINIAKPFVQDNHSRSRKGTLRGMHYQLNHPQEKLVYAVTGSIYDAVVDIRKGSPWFGKWVGVELSESNKRQIFVPVGFAHGFCVLSESADVIYKSTDFYNPSDEYGILWSDACIGIDWPIVTPIITKKDSLNPKLSDAEVSNLPLYKQG